MVCRFCLNMVQVCCSGHANGFPGTGEQLVKNFILLEIRNETLCPSWGCPSTAVIYISWTWTWLATTVSPGRVACLVHWLSMLNTPFTIYSIIPCWLTWEEWESCRSHIGRCRAAITAHQIFGRASGSVYKWWCNFIKDLRMIPSDILVIDQLLSRVILLAYHGDVHMPWHVSM